MKKKFGFGVGLAILSCLLLTKGLMSVSASPLIPDLGTGTWSTGTESTIDLEKYPAPYNWYQLVEKGVKVSKAGEICHPFRGGQFKWVGDIRQLVDGKWKKINTTQGWLKGPESTYQICAQAPAAGTYALFAYYTGPNENLGSSCAEGLTLIASSPIDFVNNATQIEWSGTSWSSSEITNWNTDYCNVPVYNYGESDITVVVRYGDNTCVNETVTPVDAAWISGVIADGVCPLAVYQQEK
jgi:hypothetical protein